jgi:hypothetical protein
MLSMITGYLYPPLKLFQDLIKPILPSIKGISGPDLQAVQFVKGVIDDKTISPAFQGQITGVSATESVQSKNQTLMRLGLPLFGIIKMETDITVKYIYNILTHWTRKQASGYRKIELDSEFPDGTSGRNIVDFTAMYLEPEQIAAEEGLLAGLYGKPVKKYNVNPAILKNIKFKWDVTMTPQEKDADVMKRQAFNATVKDAYAMFTPAALNQEFLKGQFAQLNKWPKEKAFNQPQAMAPQDPMAMAAQSLSPPGENGINNAIGNMVPRQGAAAPPTPEELMQLLK